MSVSQPMFTGRPTQWALLLGLLSALCLQSAQAFDLNQAMLNTETPFSATQTITSGKDSFTTQMYREGEKMRMDVSEQGQEVSIVMRLDKDTNYMLMHEMSMYQEVKNKRIKQYQTDMGVQFTNQQELGRERVNGVDTTKYTADYKDNDGQTGTGTYWVSDNNIVIRAVMDLKRRRKVTQTTIDLTNLKVGDQPDELFEVPANYNSLNFGGLFNNAMRQSNRNQPESDQERAERLGDEEPVEPEAEAPKESNAKKARRALGNLFKRGNG